MSHTRDHIIIQKITAFLTQKLVGPVQVWHAAAGAAAAGALVFFIL